MSLKVVIFTLFYMAYKEPTQALQLFNQGFKGCHYCYFPLFIIKHACVCVHTQTCTHIYTPHLYAYIHIPQKIISQF